MSHIVDIITARDVDLLLEMGNAEKAAKRLAEHHAALREEITKVKRWKDGRGVIHELRGHVAYNVVVTSSVVWKPACGYRYTSRVTLVQDWPVTCLACLTMAQQAYMCRRCGHAEPEHDDKMCFDCVEQTLPAPCTGFDPDYRYPYEPEE